MNQQVVGFIADLHLTPQQPQIMRLFTQMLANPPKMSSLYILGDLFEYWIGDDAYDHGYQPVIDALSSASTKGLDIAIMHGNRDFLIGTDFVEQCGCRLIDNDSVIEIDGSRVLITHGDLLCSDDSDYLNLYNTIRTDEWKKEFLSKGANERIAFAEQLRQKSKDEIAKKRYSDLDVNQQTVESTLERFQVDILIHGHTHKQNIHHFGNKTRYVLGDWKTEKGNILLFSDAKGQFVDVVDNRN